MSHPDTPRRVLQGPRGSIAVEIRRYAKPGRFVIAADDGDMAGEGTERTLAELVAAGWVQLKLPEGGAS